MQERPKRVAQAAVELSGNRSLAEMANLTLVNIDEALEYGAAEATYMRKGILKLIETIEEVADEYGS